MFRIVRWFMDKIITLSSPRADLQPFLDNASFPWIAGVEDHWTEIRDEFDAVRADTDIPNVEDISADGNLGADRKPMSRGSEWRWFFLYGFGHKLEDNCARCPRTTKIVESIPGMRGAIFAVLAPGKHIPQHRGLYKGLLRYHIGLRVPGAPGQCRIEVGGETRAWQDGRSFIFDDTFTHEVWNDTTEFRVVFMIDVERPLSGVTAALNRLVLRWIYSTSYITDAIDNARVPATSRGPQTGGMA